MAMRVHENGTRHDLEPGDKLEIPRGSLHAEGEISLAPESQY